MYLSEFEIIFDKNIETSMDSKYLRAFKRNSIKVGNMPLSKDVTHVETNLVIGF